MFFPWSSELIDIFFCMGFFKFRIIGWTCNYFMTSWFIESKTIFHRWHLPNIIGFIYRSTLQKILVVAVFLEQISLNWFLIWRTIFCYRNIEIKNEFLSKSSTWFSSHWTAVNTSSLISPMLTVTDGGRTLLFSSILSIPLVFNVFGKMGEPISNLINKHFPETLTYFRNFYLQNLHKFRFLVLYWFFPLAKARSVKCYEW